MDERIVTRVKWRRKHLFAALSNRSNLAEKELLGAFLSLHLSG